MPCGDVGLWGWRRSTFLMFARISAKNPGRFGRARGKQEGAKVAAHRKHLAWDAIQTSPLHSNTCDRGISCLKSTVRVQQHCFRTCK